MWKKQDKTRFTFNAEKVFLAATQPLATAYGYFQTHPCGLSLKEVERRQSYYGKNEVEHEKRKNPVTMFIRAFINPFRNPDHIDRHLLYPRRMDGRA